MRNAYTGVSRHAIAATANGPTSQLYGGGGDLALKGWQLHARPQWWNTHCHLLAWLIVVFYHGGGCGGPPPEIFLIYCLKSALWGNLRMIFWRRITRDVGSGN